MEMPTVIARSIFGQYEAEVLEEHSNEAGFIEICPNTVRVVTHSEFDKLVAQHANKLSTLLPPGARVLVSLRNQIEFASMIMACWRADMIPAPIPMSWGKERVTRISQRLDAALAIVEADCVDDSENGNVVDFVSLDGVARGTIGLFLQDAGWMSEEDELLIMHSSGSSATPKSVLIGKKGMMWFECAERQLGPQGAVEGRPICIIAGPLFHFSGLLRFLEVFRKGGTGIFLKYFDPVLFNEVIRKYQVTHVAGTPTLFAYAALEARLTPGGYPSLRYLRVGGARCTTEEIERIAQAYGCPAFQVYGATELGPIAAGPRPCDFPILHPESVGVALPGVDIELIKQDKAGIGTIRVRTPGCAVGIITDDGRFPCADENGWIETADLGWWDEAGHLRVIGRADDIFIVGGENVSPAEIEAILLAYPDIVEACVVPISHPMMGSVASAGIAVRADFKGTEREIRDHCRRRASPHAVPHRIRFFSELPRLDSGKLDRRQISEIITYEC